MEEIVGHVLSAWADFEDRHDFVDGTHGRPDPGDGLFVGLGRVGEIDGDVGGAEDGTEFIGIVHVPNLALACNYVKSWPGWNYQLLITHPPKRFVATSESLVHLVQCPPVASNHERFGSHK